MFVVVVPVERRGPKSNLLAPFEPATAIFSPLLHGEDGDAHALAVESVFFDYVEEGEFAQTFACVAHAEEEPGVVAVGVQVVL